MSGFAIGYGEPEKRIVEEMFERIAHRGDYLSGIFEKDGAVLAQNYLRADTSGASEASPVPVRESSDRKAIVYDGQIGNWEELAAAYGIEDGPFREERLLLGMYEKEGPAMLERLGDSIFAFAIVDGEEILAARDLLGIKTLFYAKENGALYVSSELKGIRAVSEEVFEFPPASRMDGEGRLTKYASLPEEPSDPICDDVDEIAREIRRIIAKSVRSRVDFERPTAGLLSGGMDSSVICLQAKRLFEEKRGGRAKLRTFSIGLGESGDIRNARVMAACLESEHRERIIGLEEVLEALPEVIYYLENFDPSLVRSSVSNYLVSKFAAEEGIEVLLSGEGGDEVFCGYLYLKETPHGDLFRRQVECLDFLHNNASLRLDRMNLCHSVKVIAPLISGELLDYAFRIPPKYKMREEGDRRIEKWIFRKAYEDYLPEVITWRTKQEFSQGSGSADVLPLHFEETIIHRELTDAREKHPFIRSKD